MGRMLAKLKRLNWLQNSNGIKFLYCCHSLHGTAMAAVTM